jgi:hypothetical protein
LGTTVAFVSESATQVGGTANAKDLRGCLLIVTARSDARIDVAINGDIEFVGRTRRIQPPSLERLRVEWAPMRGGKRQGIKGAAERTTEDALQI